MSSKTGRFLFFYAAAAMLFFGLVLFFSYMPKDYDSLKSFSRASGMSDAAFYTSKRAVRFYSLSKAEDLWDDPFLPPRSRADFLYRMRK